MKLYFDDKEIGRSLTRQEFIEVVKRDPGAVYDSIKKCAVAFDLDGPSLGIWALIYVDLDGNVCIDDYQNIACSTFERTAEAVE
jgi:hypothetical protein